MITARAALGVEQGRRHSEAVERGVGARSVQRQLLEGLRAAGCNRRRIERILVTHMHRGHYRQAATIRQECGPPVALWAQERTSLEMYLVGGDSYMLGRVARLRVAGPAEQGGVCRFRPVAVRTDRPCAPWPPVGTR